MRLIEIQALQNGAHRNQSGYFGTVPEGWAVIPDDMKTENFPFGELDVEEIDGVLTVTNWTPGEMPKPEPEPEPGEDDSPVTWKELDAAYREGVNAV